METQTKKTILLVEDEAIIAIAGAQTIREFGYNVITSGSGEKAVELFKKANEINLVLMDINLGKGIDGPQAAIQILALKTVPIVFLTSHSERDMVETVKGITRYGYVIKNSGDFVLQSSIEMAFELFSAHNSAIEREDRLLRTELISGFGSWEIDLKNKTVTASKGARKIYGFGDENLTLECIQKDPLPQYRDMLNNSLKNLIEHGDSYDVVFEIKRRTDSKNITIHSIAKYDAAHNIITGIFQDITDQKLLENNLKFSTEMFSMFMRHSPIYTFIKEVSPEKSIVIQASENYSQMIGINGSDMTGKSMEELFPPEFAAKMTADDWNVVSKGLVLKLDEDFGDKYYTSIKFPIVLGTKHLLAGYTIDISEWKQTEKKLRECIQYSRNIIESCIDPLTVIDVNGKIADANAATENITGVFRNSLIGSDFSDYFTDSSKAHDAYNEVLKNGVIIDYPLSIRHRNGYISDVLYNASLFQNENGSIAGVLASARDITALKKAEENIRESEKRFRSMFLEHSAVMLLIEPDTGRIIDSNFSAVKFYGYDKTTLCSMNISELNTLPQDQIAVRRNFAMSRNQNFFIFPHRLSNGETRTVEVHSSPITYQGKYILFSIIHDITERKHAEEKIQKLLSDKEFILKEVHHRIKNNMNTINSLLSLQASNTKEPTIIAALNDAGSRVRSMMVLYSNLYQSANFDDISIKDYLSDLSDQIITNFPNCTSVKIEKQIKNFILDAKKASTLGIIINELLTNIMKYAFLDRTNGIITISASKNNSVVTVSVQDNGSGMPEFINFDNSTGFGLKLIEALTMQINGTIRIERKNGTTVILEFAV